MTNPTITLQLRALQTATAADLADRYIALFGKPPRVRNRAWLFRQVAWKLQERELGGISERARNRLNELLAKIDLPMRDAPPTPRRAMATAPTAPAARDRRDPAPGTELTRKWRDQDIRVRVLDDGGFDWNGARYGSLSAVAKAITGASWNGRLFFGLVERRPAS